MRCSICPRGLITFPCFSPAVLAFPSHFSSFEALKFSSPVTNWIAVLPSYKPDGCLLWTQSDAGSRATLCHLFTLLVIVICLFLDPFRGCGSVGAETSALVPVQGSSHQQPWQQRLHHTQQALHVQQRWRPRTVFGAGLLLIYLLCVCPDSSVNF